MYSEPAVCARCQVVEAAVMAIASVINACTQSNAMHVIVHQRCRDLLRFDIERDQREGLLQLHADAQVAITTAGKCLAPSQTR